MKYLIKFLLLFFIISCTNQSNETRAFEEYLQNNFKIKIGSEITNYVIIPKNLGCSGCKQLAIIKIENLKKTTNKLIIILPQNTEGITCKHTLLIDSLGEIENYNLNTQNVCIIKTQNNNVKSITSTNSLNVDSIFTNYTF
jgi:hypothetical protein